LLYQKAELQIIDGKVKVLPAKKKAVPKQTAKRYVKALDTILPE